jgi:hypothetical protein
MAAREAAGKGPERPATTNPTAATQPPAVLVTIARPRATILPFVCSIVPLVRPLPRPAGGGSVWTEVAKASAKRWKEADDRCDDVGRSLADFVSTWSAGV